MSERTPGNEVSGEDAACPRCHGTGRVPLRKKGTPAVHLRSTLPKRSACGTVWTKDLHDQRLTDDPSQVTCGSCRGSHMSRSGRDDDPSTLRVRVRWMTPSEAAHDAGAVLAALLLGSELDPADRSAIEAAAAVCGRLSDIEAPSHPGSYRASESGLGEDA